LLEQQELLVLEGKQDLLEQQELLVLEEQQDNQDRLLLQQVEILLLFITQRIQSV
jgi:hypothetical protein